MSKLQEVSRRIKRMRKGVPFYISNFYDLGSKSAIQKAFIRLIQQGEIKRLDRGIYSRPKHLRFSEHTYLGSAEDLAKLWAKKHGYILVNQGMEEAYRLGIQTQAPMKKIYWTNGNSKIFSIGNETIQLVHQSNPMMLRNTIDGAILRGFSVINTKSLSINILTNIFKRLSLSNNQILRLINKLSYHPYISSEFKLTLENSRKIYSESNH